jgi:hypothetical protein
MAEIKIQNLDQFAAKNLSDVEIQHLAMPNQGTLTEREGSVLLTSSLR